MVAIQKMNSSEFECKNLRKAFKRHGKFFTWGATRQATSEVDGDRGGGCAFISKKPLILTTNLPDLNAEDAHTHQRRTDERGSSMLHHLRLLLGQWPKGLQRQDQLTTGQDSRTELLHGKGTHVPYGRLQSRGAEHPGIPQHATVGMAGPADRSI